MQPNKNKKKQPNPNFFRRALYVIIVFMAVIWLANLFGANMGGFAKKLKYPEFYFLVKNNPQTNQIKTITLKENLAQGQFNQPKEQKYFYVYIPEENEEIVSLIRENVEDFEIEPASTALTNFLYFFGPMFIFILFLWYFSKKGNQMGSQIWGFGKSKHAILDKNRAKKVTFGNVAGIDEAKEEL
ncbi:MAG: hypothetical protein R6U54_00975, partial [Candidatus Omnitrophota bacterium]